MKSIITISAFFLFSLSVTAQKDSSNKLGGLFKKASSLLTKSSSSTSNLSTDEIISGLKEALSLGAQKSTDKLSTPDGFFKDAAVKILLPKEVQDIEKKNEDAGNGQNG